MEKEIIEPVCKQLHETHCIPGITVAVVNLHDTIPKSLTYSSSKNISAPQISDKTIFGLGSVSKSFTSACLSILLSSNQL